MARAISICSTAGPVVPIGKKRLGSESRQAASSRQSVIVNMIWGPPQPLSGECETFHKDGRNLGPGLVPVKGFSAGFCGPVRAESLPTGPILVPAMSIREEFAAELKDAMRHKDRRRLDVIRQVESEVSRAKSEPGFTGEVDDTLYALVIAAYIKKNSFKTIHGEIRFGANGEWEKSGMLQVQYHGIKPGAGLETWRGMDYQTVLTPANLKTGNVIYPYEKAKQ